MKIYSTFAKLWVENRVAFLLFIYYVNINLYATAFSNLILQKTCFPEGPPGTNVICNNTEAFKEYNKVNSVKSTVREVLPGFIVLLAGSWRDQTGLSLPLILIALGGDLITECMTLLFSLMWDFSSWAMVILDTFFSATGSRALFTVASMAYITERIPPEQRAVKLVAATVAILGGMCVSSACAGFLLNLLNYNWYSVMVIVNHLLIVALSFHAYQDGERKNPGVKIRPITILRGLKVVFVPRKNFFVIWVLLSSSFALAGLMNGEATVTHSFFQKVLFLNPERAGLLQSYRLLSSLIMSFIAIPVLIGVFKLTEFAVAIISIIPIAACCFCMAFVSSERGAYIFYTLDMMRLGLTTVLWAKLSKSVPKCETGVYVSFLMFGEAITPFFINPLYVFIFNHTIDYFPGAFFIVSGCIVLTTTILLIISSYLYEESDDDVKISDEKKLADVLEFKSNAECAI